MNIKNNLYKIGYIISIILLTLLIFMIILWHTFITYQNKVSNHFIGINAISFHFKNSAKLSILDLRKIYNNMDDFMISIINQDKVANVTTIQVLNKGKIDTPKLLSGRFFNENDFTNSFKYAVVGKNILKSNLVYKLNGTSFYKFSNNNYEIIGVIDNKDNSSLDNDAFITMCNSNLLNNQYFIIDGNSQRIVNQNYHKINYLYNTIKNQTPKNYLESSINDLNQQNNLILATSVFIVFLLILSNRYFINTIKQEINVKVILGIDSRRILTEFSILPANIYILSYCIIIIITFIINNFIFSFNFIYVLKNTLFCIFIFFLITLIMAARQYISCIRNSFKD